MSKYLSLSLLLLLCAGCAEDWQPRSASSRAAQRAEGSISAAQPQVESRRRRRSFASLPDKGNLVGYPKQRVVRHDGAYTWHRADISENHALRAIVDGSMRITTPSGEALDFKYERHIEHPSGDWTWVGRIERGAESEEAIITFGERAAFGSIAQPGGPSLKLTIRDGVAWLVETDPAKVALIDNAATRPTGADYLVPPKLSATADKTSTASPSKEASVATAAVGATAANTTVDVLLGYTNGFASALGGASQAITRLNNMIEISNQAYANSQVAHRIRLVHAMQVNYPDNTSNDATLEALTGFRAPSTRTTPDPAFAALRAARDQYGADLVSLVRKFQSPENDGCGVAWLIGGNRSGIGPSDEYFGYSVVSDGSDVGSDGKNYFCRDETLVHELGHNMGSQHDRATATENGTLKYGLYDFSFGYKSGPNPGDFYTVMAYGDRDANGVTIQRTSYRVFSNPRTSFCGGMPCGIAEQADNARSLDQAMPIIATFRAALPDSNAFNLRFCDAGLFDFNGDTVSDLFWRHGVDGWNAIWNSGLSGQERAVTPVPSQLWQVAAVGDFNGDRKSDLIWRHSVDGWNVLWPSASSQLAQNMTPVASQIWKVVGVGDFNLDGRSDVLWRHMQDGWNHVWLGGNSGSPLDLSAVPSKLWRVAAVADFNGDQRADILWRHVKDGWNALWLGGASSNAEAVSPMSSEWNVAATGDFTGDTRADIVWRNSSNGRNVLWPAGQSSGAVELTSVPSSVWEIVGAGDFTADGRLDLVWRHNVDGWNLLWPSANSQLARDLSPVPSQTWQVSAMCRQDAFVLQ